jgi:hypothetical protein
VGSSWKKIIPNPRRIGITGLWLLNTHCRLSLSKEGVNAETDVPPSAEGAVCNNLLALAVKSVKKIILSIGALNFKTTSM